MFHSPKILCTLPVYLSPPLPPGNHGSFYPWIIFHCLDRLFIHLPTKRHLGCFQVSSVMNKDSIKIMCSFLYGHIFSNPLDKYQGVEFHFLMKSYSSLKKKEKEILTFATAWMKLKGIMLSEISQTERQALHVITYMWNYFKK